MGRQERRCAITTCGSIEKQGISIANGQFDLTKVPAKSGKRGNGVEDVSPTYIGSCHRDVRQSTQATTSPVTFCLRHVDKRIARVVSRTKLFLELRSFVRSHTCTIHAVSNALNCQMK
jgi:hypothetical protein